MGRGFTTLSRCLAKRKRRPRKPARGTTSWLLVLAKVRFQLGKGSKNTSNNSSNSNNNNNNNTNNDNSSNNNNDNVRSLIVSRCCRSWDTRCCTGVGFYKPL